MLESEHEAGRRNVAPSSLSQYLSAIRLMSRTVSGRSVPPMRYLYVATRAYAAWYTAPRSARRGATADLMHRVYLDGMANGIPLRLLCDCALLVATYMLGLNASSSLSLKAEDVEVTAEALNVRLSVCKGRSARDHPHACYIRISPNAPSPLDLLLRWQARRPAALEWLGGTMAVCPLKISRRSCGARRGASAVNVMSTPCPALACPSVPMPSKLCSAFRWRCVRSASDGLPILGWKQSACAHCDCQPFLTFRWSTDDPATHAVGYADRTERCGAKAFRRAVDQRSPLFGVASRAFIAWTRTRFPNILS